MDNFEWLKGTPLIDESIFRRDILGIFDEPINICSKLDKINKKENLKMFNDYDYIKIPTKNCLNIERESNSINTISKTELAFIGEPIFENKKEKEGNNNMEEILKIYEKNQLKKIDNEKAEKIEKIKNESQIGKIVSNLKKQADKELSKIIEDYDKNENVINIDFELDPITKKKTHKIVNEAFDKIGNLKNRIEEVKSLLNITENYEQKIEILKNYKILDEKGKIMK